MEELSRIHIFGQACFQQDKPTFGEKAPWVEKLVSTCKARSLNLATPVALTRNKTLRSAQKLLTQPTCESSASYCFRRQRELNLF